MTMFSAGTYYIGDPCYVVANNKWYKLLIKTNYLGDGEFIYRKQQCFSAGTAWGDGKYDDNYGREYFVDAGLIGIMTITALDKNKEGKGGQIITFEKDFDVQAARGIFYFGNITINTRDCDDDEAE